MKKTFFTLMLLAVAALVSAQDLQFEFDGTVYHDGDTIVSPFNEMAGEYIQTLYLRNLTDNELNVVVEREILQNVPGTTLMFCWRSCLLPDVNISQAVPIPAQTLSTDEFSSHVLFDVEQGVVITKYYAYSSDQDEPNNRISIIIKAGTSGSGVAENTLNVGKAYPNPASSQVHFNLKANSNSDVKVMVYNLLGQEVKSQWANGSTGRINLAVDDLQPGIYFCSFLVNNEVVKTEKFIVKR